jgi:hypothetical protein
MEYYETIYEAIYSACKTATLTTQHMNEEGSLVILCEQVKPKDKMIEVNEMKKKKCMIYGNHRRNLGRQFHIGHGHN